jgi:hypothetical protein
MKEYWINQKLCKNFWFWTAILDSSTIYLQIWQNITLGHVASQMKLIAKDWTHKSWNSKVEIIQFRPKSWLISILIESDNKKKKQILVQQLVRAFPFGISRQICFFYEVGLSDQCPQPFLNEEKTLTYPGFEHGTFGFQVGNATNWTIEVVNLTTKLFYKICSNKIYTFTKK